MEHSVWLQGPRAAAAGLPLPATKGLTRPAGVRSKWALVSHVSHLRGSESQPVQPAIAAMHALLATH